VGVVTLAFFLIRLIPGNPAQALAGPGANQETIASIEHQLGLDKPIPVQYAYFWRDLLHGYLGYSIYSGHPVTDDLRQRIPATLELTLTSMIIIVFVGVPLGIFVALRKRGIAERVVFAYGMLTGGLPDFWIGLIFIFVFFFLFRWAPSPMGRTGAGAHLESMTGFVLIDAALQGKWDVFQLGVGHLILPVLTLVVVYMGQVVKMTRSCMEEVAGSDFMDYARACGLPRLVMIRYQLRNGLAPVVTSIAFTNGYLLGGTVLVETVFAWGGVGQYAVQSVICADYWPLQGFVLAAAVYMSVNYLLMDIIHALLDPRVRLR
jgi:peptide/nickel transport system permease protein